MAKNPLSESIIRWDKLIRAGQAQLVHNEIAKFQLRSIPHRLRREVASLLKRIGDFEQALRVLTPVILNGDSQYLPKINPRDLAEYAILLLKVGRKSEAIGLLYSIDEKVVKQKHLYIAFCFFSTLDYEASIPHMQKYLSNPNLTEYEKLTGEVNQLNVYLQTNQLERAEELSDQLIVFCEKRGYSRFLANCKELKAKVYLKQGKLKEAQVLIGMAKAKLEQDSGRYLLWVQQGEAQIEATKKGSIEPLKKFRQQCVQMKSYEGVRETDVQILRHQYSPDLFRKIYFGSSHDGFKKSLLKDFNQEIPAEWKHGSSSRVLNIHDGSFCGKPFLKKGQKPHQLMMALMSDLYRPMSVARLHEIVYPEEIFNVFYVTNKMKQLIHRLGKAFRLASIPIELHLIGNKVHWKIHGDVSLLYHRDKKHIDRESAHLSKLSDHFGNETFKRAEAEEVLGFSSAQAKRVLAQLVQSKKVLKLKNGRQISYQVTLNSNLKAA